jgi:hypothetical protein
VRLSDAEDQFFASLTAITPLGVFCGKALDLPLMLFVFLFRRESA